ncbi:hypothetical protein [Flavobacterium gelatinilyticum]|uniref:hypothetical protein n=1 Tax=Flavobacterium gelatinilyticum TaxID=3003260 RepID=UPI0024815B80|nr:hypothetical protein [Flavobacterium gelatinilyticum]
MKWDLELNVFNSIVIIYTFFILFSTVFMSYAFVNKNNVETKVYTVIIKGYYTRKVDGVLFDFKGKTFDRPFDLANQVSKPESSTENFYKKYRLKLSVKEFDFDIYYLNSIDLIRKEELSF